MSALLQAIRAATDEGASVMMFQGARSGDLAIVVRKEWRTQAHSVRRVLSAVELAAAYLDAELVVAYHVREAVSEIASDIARAAIG